jgi:hypothetical protein
LLSLPYRLFAGRVSHDSSLGARLCHCTPRSQLLQKRLVSDTFS